MYTVLELLNLSTDYLEKKGIESPRLNSELMLAGIMKCKRLELYLAFDKPLGDAEVERYREYLKRRGKFEPLQYILGEVEFYGLNFKVNPSVLIPRQETEILIETLLNSIKPETCLKILDIGTGSGIIALTLAKKLPGAYVTAIDISTEALKTARANAELLKVEDRVTFLEADILTDTLENLSAFDIVVSNPPYVSLNEYGKLQNEILHFEPKIALTDLNDGFKFYETISRRAVNLLNDNGFIAFEAGEGQAQKISEIMQSYGYSNITKTKDYLNIDRVITGVKN